MARMPEAVWQGEHGSTPMSRYDIVCVHTIVGRAPAHAAHLSTDGYGGIYQSRDTRFRSAANYNGNPRIIAVENQDFGEPFPVWNFNDGHAVPGFTAAQMESIARILVWAYFTHGIPLVLCPDSRPGSRGVAYHRQGVDGNFAGYSYPGRVAGGELWTTARGKVCPGDRRISQLIEVIIPRARVLAGLDRPPVTQESEYDNVFGGSWPASGEATNELIVCPTGNASAVVKNAWLSLATVFDGVIFADVYFVGDGDVTLHEELGLHIPSDTRRWWKLPNGTTHVTVRYSCTQPVGWAVETEPRPSGQ
jgi:hypothetical protein